MIAFQRFGERYVVRLASGEPLMASLSSLLERERVEFASLSAAGAVASIRLAYWNAETRRYQEREFAEQLEVVSFEGNASLKDGRPFLHLHGAFARSDYSVIGGHIMEARVHPTMEVWLRTEDVPVRRAHDPATGLDLLDLPKQAG